MKIKTIIVDFGANDGSNLDYYLGKSDKVIAVEANLELCRLVSRKYSEEIKNGQLLVLNFAIVPADSDKIPSMRKDYVEFWINRNNNEVSTLVTPANNSGEFYKLKVPAITAPEVIKKFVDPDDFLLYFKIDLEGLDELVLRDLFNASIFPKFISAEAQDMGSFSQILSSGQYNSFNYRSGKEMVKGLGLSGVERLSREILKPGRAGLFGDDLENGWYNSTDTSVIMSLRGYGWNDLHARRIHNAEEPGIPIIFFTRILVVRIVQLYYQEVFSIQLRRKLFRIRQGILTKTRRLHDHLNSI